MPSYFFESIGICESCLRLSLSLKAQTNFGVQRKMCTKCCAASNEAERIMFRPRLGRADKARERWMKNQVELQCWVDAAEKEPVLVKP